jgi:hypothetical protein
VSDAASAQALLLSCAVWDADAAQLERVRVRAHAVRDWSAWMRLTRMHRLVPHAQRALLESGAAIPDDCALALQDETIAIGARALARARQLAELASVLARDEVRALAFKGPTLSLAAYGNVGVRESVDLDIVVLPRDLDRARDTLRAAGYVSRTRMSPAQERTLQRSFGHFTYVREGTPASGELHWRFAAPRYPWSLPPEQVLSRSRSIVIAGAQVAVAEPTDELLLQAMHGVRHQWECLEWLVAFERLMRVATVDQRTLVERARANGSRRALAVSVRLANDLLGAPLSPRLDAISRDGTTVALAGEIVRGIANAADAGELPTQQPYSFNQRMMDGTGARARYLALSVFAPTVREWELVRLPDGLRLLYYPVRLLRVLVLQPIRFARAAFRRLRAPDVKH